MEADSTATERRVNRVIFILDDWIRCRRLSCMCFRVALMFGIGCCANSSRLLSRYQSFLVSRPFEAFLFKRIIYLVNPFIIELAGQVTNEKTCSLCRIKLYDKLRLSLITLVCRPDHKNFRGRSPRSFLCRKMSRQEFIDVLSNVW